MSHGILPERFSDGDFGSWLQHFERCALANSWDDDKRLAMLPAFLQGPAATYFESLPTDRRDTIVHLRESLLACFSPLVDRECHYRKFEEMTLRPSEDPTLFLWRMKDCLRRAEPDLSDSAFDALLRRQFMRALPSGLKIKLLESDPTPTLDTMISFAQRFRALRDLPFREHDITACTDTPSIAPAQLTSAADVSKVTAQQQQHEDRLSRLQERMDELVATISVPSHTVTAPKPIVCFHCHKEGHIARTCPLRPRNRQLQMGHRQYSPRPQWPKMEEEYCCTVCGGYGHLPEHCANHRIMDSKLLGRKSSVNFPSLNFQGVPR